MTEVNGGENDIEVREEGFCVFKQCLSLQADHHHMTDGQKKSSEGKNFHPPNIKQFPLKINYGRTTT